MPSIFASTQSICKHPPVPLDKNLGNCHFEASTEARAGADGRVNGWTMASPQVPAAWSLNPAYPGELTVCRSEPGRPAAHGGERFVRLAGRDSGAAHVYQTCQGLEAGKWYRVSAWVRGGAVSLSFYEYFQSQPIGGQTVAESTGGGEGWKLIEGFYRPPLKATSARPWPSACLRERRSTWTTCGSSRLPLATCRPMATTSPWKTTRCV